MVLWQFWVYHTATGRDVIQDWRRKDLEPQQRADMDSHLLIWRNQKQWDAKDFKALGGGLFELRFTSCKKQLRLIGFHWPAKQLGGLDNFTFVMGCSHKQRIYDPADALGTAAQRAGNLKKGIGSHHAYS